MFFVIIFLSIKKYQVSVYHRINDNKLKINIKPRTNFLCKYKLTVGKFK